MKNTHCKHSLWRLLWNEYILSTIWLDTMATKPANTFGFVARRSLTGSACVHNLAERPKKLEMQDCVIADRQEMQFAG